MNKAPDAFRTISEVAEELDIPQHVLRFWETRFSSIRPLKRGGGRRYYRPDDVDLLRGIRQLLYGQGYTIKGVQRILKQDGLRFVQGVGRGEPVVLPDATHDAGEETDDVASPLATAGPHAERDWAADEAEPRPGDGPSAAYSFAASSADMPARDRGSLRSALEELVECQRALDTLKRS